MGELTKEMLLTPHPPEVTAVEIGDCVVYLRPMSSAWRDRVVAFAARAAGDPEKMAGMSALVVAGCHCDEAGARVSYSTKEIGMLAEGVDADNLDKLFQVAQRISGLSKEGEDKAKNSLPASDSGSN